MSSHTARRTIRPVTSGCQLAFTLRRFMPLRISVRIRPPMKRAEQRARAAEQRRAADDHRRDGRQRQGFADVAFGGVQPRQDRSARQGRPSRRRATNTSVTRLLDRNARQPRRDRRSRRWRRSAGRRSSARSGTLPISRNADHQVDRDGNAEQIATAERAKAGREAVHRLAAPCSSRLRLARPRACRRSR